MRVAIIVRTTLETVKGGDTVQILQTAANLQRYNVVVDIIPANEKINYTEYDLLHFFNITRPADILIHIKHANKPYIISPILIDYSEYDRLHRKGLSGVLLRWLSIDGIEYAKTVMRWLTGKDKLVSLSYLWTGQRNAIRKILQEAKLLLPNSESEYTRIVERYKCNPKYIVVPNGIDPGLFTFNNKIPKDPLLVLCVARVEGIKNQLNLIRALNNTKFTLVLIGSATPGQPAYYRACKNIAAKNIIFIEHLEQQQLVEYYQRAKVHVLPSWFETTGLSSLEAASMGCSIVITDRGDASEYFGNDAVYCEPGSVTSILKAVEEASQQSLNASLQKRILTQYTWEQATIRTLEAYEV